MRDYQSTRYPRRPLLSRRYPRLVRVEVPASGANGQHGCVCEASREHGFRCILGYVQRVPSSPRSLDGYPRIKPAYTLAPLIWCNYYTLRGCTVALSTKLFLFFFFFPPFRLLLPRFRYKFCHDSSSLVRRSWSTGREIIYTREKVSSKASQPRIIGQTSLAEFQTAFFAFYYFKRQRDPRWLYSDVCYESIYCR